MIYVASVLLDDDKNRRIKRKFKLWNKNSYEYNVS